ncbi:hypothetical protein D9758_019131 [Tetrapyrgos nigripes]|uniref:CCHC-type domain-containing protein n=1 Tax=Tetrapyrgos nigripes TaxID=182062 RepID=A0A8H5ET91_9AGAR|nr:hypothetical protein D9758_019131 [Tetrapyrgos nigripes]
MNGKMLIFCGAQRSVHPGPPKPTFPSRAQPQGHSLFPIQFPTPAASPFLPLMWPALPKLPSPRHSHGSRCLRQRFLACTCYTCGKTGHFSAACPDCQREHVRSWICLLMTGRRLQKHAAFQDFQAALMNKPTQEDFAKDQE